MQNVELTSELFWLVLTVSMTGIFWAPYIMNRIYEEGVLKAIWNPEPDAGPKAKWAVRMMVAHDNAVENLVIFAPLVLIIQVLSINNETTAFACSIYFFSRFAHYIVFSLGIPLLRVIIFFVSFYTQVVLALEILKLI